MFTRNLILRIRESHFNFAFARTHYNIYPWIDLDERLVRVVRFAHHKEPSVVFISHKAGRDGSRLMMRVVSAFDMQRNEATECRSKLEWALGLCEPTYPGLQRFATEDRIIAAALRVNRGIRPKRYLDIFEAICGAICAQNVDFRRLYHMMKALAVKFGPSLRVDGVDFHGFPLATEIADVSEEDIRSCKVGYRAKMILRAAQFLRDNPKLLDMEVLRSTKAAEASDLLCNVPGIGPYSAGIVLGAGVGRLDVFHLDSFTRHILHTFYFNGREVDDKELMRFAASRWGDHAGSIAHLLTTNTHEWAEKLGYQGFRPSGAKA